MSDLRLSLAISDYVHTADIANSRISPIGIKFTVSIFTSSAFRHSAVYVNQNSGINRLEDLKGRRVGIPQW